MYTFILLIYFIFYYTNTYYTNPILLFPTTPFKYAPLHRSSYYTYCCIVINWTKTRKISSVEPPIRLGARCAFWTVTRNANMRLTPPFIIDTKHGRFDREDTCTIVVVAVVVVVVVVPVFGPVTSTVAVMMMMMMTTVMGMTHTESLPRTRTQRHYITTARHFALRQPDAVALS